MRRSFRALFVTGLCLALAAVATPAFAGPGDLDKTFSGDGIKAVDYGGSAEYFYGVAVHGSAPAGCGYSSNEATLTVFTPGGAFDKTFSGDGMWRHDLLGHGYSYLEACRFLPDGRLVAVGGARGADGNDRIIVVVVRPNGKLDTSFSGDGIAVVRFNGVASSDAYDLAIQPDGKIVVAGEGYDSSFTPAKGFFEVARLRPNGSLDKTFSGDGLAKVDFGPNDEGAWKVVVLHDGTIVLAGWIRNKANTEYNTAVAELRPNGSLDTSFSGNGMATDNFLQGGDDYALGLAVRSGGAIVLGLYGYDTTYRARVAQLKPSGLPDASFGGGDGLLTGIHADFNLQDLTLNGSDILLAGRTNGGGTPIIMRLNPGGGSDGTFGAHGVARLGSVTGYLYDIAFDTKGRIVGGGSTNTDSLILRVHA